MPVNAGGIQGDMLSGIEEESDIYEAFAPHVDFTSISLSTESSPGKRIPPINQLPWNFPPADKFSSPEEFKYLNERSEPEKLTILGRRKFKWGVR